jgi:hypothetical protein
MEPLPAPRKAVRSKDGRCSAVPSTCDGGSLGKRASSAGSSYPEEVGSRRDRRLSSRGAGQSSRPRCLPQVRRSCRCKDVTGRRIPSMRPASSLAVRWSTQLRSLRRALMGEPSSHEAWNWRIRIKVLSYLVSRYGDDPAIESHPEAGLPPISSIVPKDSAFKEHPPRSAAELRTLLHRIAEAKRPEPPSMPSRP